MPEFLQTEAGLVSRHAIVLIEDYPNPDDDSVPWPVRYTYGAEVRETTADRDQAQEFIRATR